LRKTLARGTPIVKRTSAILRQTRFAKRPRHPWLAAVDGNAILGIYFKTRQDAILYAEWVISLERETAGGSEPPSASGTGDRKDDPPFSFTPLGKW